MKNKMKFETLNVVLISLAHLVHDTYQAFLAPILPLLISKLGISIFQAGLLDIVRKIPSLFNPFIGILADRTSIRYFIIIAPIITTLSMSLIGLSPSYIFLIIMIFVSGVASALFHVPGPVMIKSFSHDKVGKGMSFFMLGGEFSRTLGPLIILGAVSLWGLEGTYKLIPFGLLASLILYLKLRNVKVAKVEYHAEDFKGIRETLIQLIPFFIAVSGFIFFRSAMKSALTIYLPTYLTDKGFTLWLAGLSLSILQFSGAGGTFLAGTLSDKIGRERILMIIAIANPILMYLFVSLKGAFMIPLLIVSGFFLFASGPVILALVHDIDTNHSSLVNGMYMSLNFVTVSLMTMLVGYSADKLGMDFTYKMTSFVSLGAIPFVVYMKIQKKRHQSDF
ncbi:MAG: MFS transporter [Spirochaetaceae bacterium]|jgi:FSR family fosmidomycin resistance protein-like MFS transporter|nr:MFS transporter [Spirochaetaceae bacterium]